MNRKMICLLGILMLVTVLFGPVSAEDRGSASGRDTLLIAGFEKDEKGVSVESDECSAETVPRKDGAGRCLQCTVGEETDIFTLTFPIQADFGKCSRLQFELKADRTIPSDEVEVQLGSKEKGFYAYSLGGIGTAWTTCSIPFLCFTRRGRLKPGDIDRIAIIGMDFDEGAVLHLDSLAMVRHPRGWDGEQRTRFTFDRPVDGSAIRTTYSRAFLARDGDDKFVRWNVPGRRAGCSFSMLLIPSDLKTLRGWGFKIRSDRPLGAGRVFARITDRKEQTLWIPLPALNRQWKSLFFPFHLMLKNVRFDAGQAKSAGFSIARSEGCSIDVDDIVFGDRPEDAWETARAVADFTLEGIPFHIHTQGSTAGIGSSSADRTRGLWWKTAGNQDLSIVSVMVSPSDLRYMQTVRLLFHSSAAFPDDGLAVIFASSRGSMWLFLPQVKAGENDLALPVKGFWVQDAFDPGDIRTVGLFARSAPPFTLHLSRMEFLAGDQGSESWKPTLEEKIRNAFGERESGRVKIYERRHFLLATPLCKERFEEFDFMMRRILKVAFRELSLTPLSPKLEVFLFKDRDACDSFQKTYRVSGMKIGGRHSSVWARFFPAFPVEGGADVNQLTERLLQAVFVRGYGSNVPYWLHSGLYRYIVLKSQGLDACRNRHLLRKKAVLIPLRTLLTEERGFSSSTHWDLEVYERRELQSLLFVAYLKDVLSAAKFSRILRSLAHRDGSPGAAIHILKTLLGLPIETLEKHWKTWLDQKKN